MSMLDLELVGDERTIRGEAPAAATSQRTKVGLRLEVGEGSKSTSRLGRWWAGREEVMGWDSTLSLLYIPRVEVSLPVSISMKAGTENLARHSRKTA